MLEAGSNAGRAAIRRWTKHGVAVGGFILAAVALASGCTAVPQPRPTSSAVWPDAPAVVTGTVAALKERGAWIDFDDHFISYDTVVVELAAPAEAQGRLVYLQFQGKPVSGGTLLRAGQTINFTLPTAQVSGCCEPYLEDIADLRVLSGGN